MAPDCFDRNTDHLQPVKDDEPRVYEDGATAVVPIRPEYILQVPHMSCWQFEMLTALYAFVQWALCTQRGIARGDVFLALAQGDGDPGPVHAQHADVQKFARRIRAAVAEEMGIDWEAYQKEASTT